MRRLILANRLSALDGVSTVGSVLSPLIDNRFVPYPYLLTFVVTRRCNSRCQMCSIWREKDSALLSLDQIGHIFRQNDFSFIRSVTLTGGEPTLRADLVEICEVVLKSTPRAGHLLLATSGLNTGRTINCVTRMLEGIEAKHDHVQHFDVQISLDGVGEVHDTVRGIAGFFQRVQATLAGLRQVQKRFPRLYLRLSCVVMPYNLPYIEVVQEFASAEELPIHYSPVVLSGNYYNNLDGESALQFSDAGESAAQTFFQRLGDEDPTSLRFYYQDMAGMIQGHARSRRCMMGFFGFVLEHDGSVYPCVNCEDASFGNLLHEPFEQVWFGRQAEEARKQLRASCCPTCTSMCYVQPVNAVELIQTKWLQLHPRR
jgi:radical SAM protein with 4Fe4S-binding SPASM domain